MKKMLTASGDDQGVDNSAFANSDFALVASAFAADSAFAAGHPHKV